MLSFDEAKKIALDMIQEIGSKSKIDLGILEDDTINFEFGWVFFYQSKKFIETSNFEFLIGGNAPIIVDKFNSNICETGTAMPTQYYIDKYIKYRDSLDTYFENI